MISLWLFGLWLGIIHALEADHVAAVAAINYQHPNASWLDVSRLGAIWGAGHGISVLVAGLVVLLFSAAVPETLSDIAEGLVGLMLIALGGHMIWKLVRNQSQHGHDGHTHTHAHDHHHPHTHDHKAIGAGLLHGLAGSAAFILLMLATISTVWAGIGFLLAFAIGNVVGMVGIAAALRVPAALTSQRWPQLTAVLQGLVAIFSMGVGGLLLLEMLA